MSKAWRNTIIALIVIWLVLTSFGLWVNSQQDKIIEWALNYAIASSGPQRTISSSLPASGVNTLRIRSINGMIELRSSTDSEVRYEATLWGRGSDDQDSMDVRAEVQGGTIVIESTHRDKNINNAGINYVIHIPQGLNIDLSLVNGMVNGAILVSGENDVVLNLVNGTVDLHMGFAAGAELATSVTNGKILVNRNEVSLSNISRSSMHYQALVNGGGANVKINVVNGSVKLTLEAGE